MKMEQIQLYWRLEREAKEEKRIKEEEKRNQEENKK
jgi:hypothetical protein